MALLAYGECDPNSKTADGKTALHLAVEVRMCVYIYACFYCCHKITVICSAIILYNFGFNDMICKHVLPLKF